MNRRDLQQLARIRLIEAGVLLRGGQPSGAYYLAGYAVECGLKACIARKTERHSFPDRTLVNRSYTHDVAELANGAGLSDDLARLRQANPRFARHWSAVADWREDSRYRLWSEQAAAQLHTAIVPPRDGVMTWIRRHW